MSELGQYGVLVVVGGARYEPPFFVDAIGSASTLVFGKLIREGRHGEEELRGLREDKLASIRSHAKFLAELPWPISDWPALTPSPTMPPKVAPLIRISLLSGRTPTPDILILKEAKEEYAKLN